jgi:glyoxylase-like metal-dependent hydrolase (beta-lactamase superfamily II)
VALRIETFVGGPSETNAYLVADDATGDAIVVDAPAGVTPAIVALAKERGWTIRQIVLTHAHWDHVVDAAAMQTAMGAPLTAHPLATERLENPAPLTGAIPIEIPPATADATIDEGDTVAVGGHAFRVLHLPGHDPAHIVLVSEPDRTLLGGDVLFPGGHGRTDIPGADEATMRGSLRRLLPLPPDTAVYPGDGAPTTIGAEAGWMQGIGG